jgi:hypothetical protein
MIIEIIVRTGKGKESKECEIDKTCDEVMRIGLRLGGKIVSGDIYCDGTSVILERK